MTFNKRNKKKKGFTLVELIAVIAILGILAAIVVPKMTGYTDSAKLGKEKANAQSILNAIDVYNAAATNVIDTSSSGGATTMANIIAGQYDSTNTHTLNGDSGAITSMENTISSITGSGGLIATGTTVKQLQTAVKDSKYTESTPKAGDFTYDIAN